MPNEAKTQVAILTSKESRDGLDALLTSESLKALYYRQRDNNECGLECHPFGLDVGNNVVTRTRPRDIRLIACPLSTDSSVEAMKIMVRQHIDDDILRLRIIRIERPEMNWNNPTEHLHDLYFELIDGCYSYLCGACNDYTGGGGYGGTILTSVFKFASAHRQIPIEVVTIPEAEAEAGVKMLDDAYRGFILDRAA